MERHGWRLRAGLRLSRLGDEWLVLDVAGGRVHRVSGAAARLIGRLLDGRDRSEVASDDELAAGLAHVGILESVHARRDVLLGAATTGLMVATTVLPAAVAAASVGPVSYVGEPGARVTVTDIVAGTNAYRLLRVELDTLDNGTVTQAFQFSERTTFDLLLVGGGGGGGTPTADDALPSAGGGGGAGEVIIYLGYNAMPGTYSVRVGGAGAAETAGGVGESGVTTVFASGVLGGESTPLAEAGGGNGGGGGGAAGGASSFGSGGGGGGATVGSTGGNVQDIAGRRNDGGDGAAGLGGGGGGAGTAGGAAGQATGGAGGAATDISEFIGLAVGSAFVAAGGGGAGATGGAGGSGGGTGASGTSASDATLGVNGTGGGGGGGYRESSGSGLRTGSRGGTGVALIRIHL